MKRALYNSVIILYLLLQCNEGICQKAIEVRGKSFSGMLHDNISNAKRQGSGFNPLIFNLYDTANLFRNDGVGINFEHIFNGAKAQHAISMFTPRQDTCSVNQLGDYRYELKWPSHNSQWDMEARMIYDLSSKEQIDMEFTCTPQKVNLYSQGFIAMMWASYMNKAVSREITFWGKEGEREGWIVFGRDKNHNKEVGTVAHVDAMNLPFEKGAQTLNLITHPTKKFITPFYYGLLDGDLDLKTKDDRLLYLVLFDHTKSIRFAMWNFIRNEFNQPDTHSPAWDWQYIVKNPKPGKKYQYRSRVVVTKFKGEQQIWDEYARWTTEVNKDLPPPPKMK